MNLSILQTLQGKSILAGLFFGAWPILMMKSGLKGNISALAFASLGVVFILPFCYKEMANVQNFRWQLVLIAGIFGAIGIVNFNGMLSKASPQSLGTFIVLVNILQTAIPVAYQFISGGTISITKVIGFIFAGFAIVLLCKNDVPKLY